MSARFLERGPPIFPRLRGASRSRRGRLSRVCRTASESAKVEEQLSRRIPSRQSRVITAVIMVTAHCCVTPRDREQGGSIVSFWESGGFTRESFFLVEFFSSQHHLRDRPGSARSPQNAMFLHFCNLLSRRFSDYPRLRKIVQAATTFATSD